MRKNVLVVEDEPAIVENIAYALGGDGFAVTSCGTGEDALGILERDQVHLIVLDVGLPDCSGFDLCKDIRKSSSVPIIFLTARSDEVDRVVGLEIGADDYMVKPFSPRELVARVKAILRRTPDVAADTRDPHAPFVIDSERMRVVYFGKPLDVSPTEFRLLEVLIRRPGIVFTRDQLLALVWKEPGAVTDRTVDAHIKAIRKRLHEVKPDLDPIETRRGVGYSLKESL